MPTDDEILRRVRTHQLARDLVNETAAGHVSDETAARLAELTLPPLKRQWVRDQVVGIRTSQKTPGKTPCPENH
jgi:hypothetical protein